MENLINMALLQKSEGALKSRIFTELQLKVLKKRLMKKKLNSNEQTYYYKYIKPKLAAIMSLFGITGLNIKGSDSIIEARREKAIKILAKLKAKHRKKKIMISGSFLFSRAYHDIDAFIFSKYEKEDYKSGKLHVTYLPEKALDALFFASLSQISISNFNFQPKTLFEVRIEDMLLIYELLINSLLNKESYDKELRDFLLITEYAAKGVVLNSKQLYSLKGKINSRKIIQIISDMLINALMLSYKMAFLRKMLTRYIKQNKALAKQYKQAENLRIYNQAYMKVIAGGDR